jgi:hypothetical protein
VSARSSSPAPCSSASTSTSFSRRPFVPPCVAAIVCVFGNDPFPSDMLAAAAAAVLTLLTVGWSRHSAARSRGAVSVGGRVAQLVRAHDS